MIIDARTAGFPFGSLCKASALELREVFEDACEAADDAMARDDPKAEELNLEAQAAFYDWKCREEDEENERTQT